MGKIVKWAIVALVVVAVVVALVAFGALESFIKQKPMGTADDYWAQLEHHELTPDVAGNWDFTLEMVDLISHSQEEFFDVPSPYDIDMFKKWVDDNKNDELALKRVYYGFSHDADYGWPQEMQGVAWMWAIAPYIWSAPSVAMIEPGKSAEAAFVVQEGIELLRSPACWRDYTITQGYGDPMRDNIMWKGPVLISEGLYTLMTGDKERYGPEMQALAHNLYETQRKNLSLPMGEGYCGGVDCEPNHWFPQCNSMGVLGLAIYDEIYGVDPKYGVKIGEEYCKAYMEFLKTYMSDPTTGMVYRKWHRYGPQQADKDLSGFANVFVSANLNPFEPEFAKNIYDHIRFRYIKKLPFGMGGFILEVPEHDIYDQVVNLGASEPGMLGETALNIFLAMIAAREHNDKETFNLINELLTHVTHPYYRQAQVRFDETNEEPSGIEGFTVGNMLNMMSGWWMFGKVHVGWEEITNHDWSQNRDEDGRMINNPR